jgi:hypothetical protein
MSSAEDRLEQVAAGSLIRARPWDVTGAALGIPMILWGFLTWFGIVGDTGGGIPGFFSGAGAAGIGLVLAASAVTMTQILSGGAYLSGAPPVQTFLAGAAAIVILGAMIAKPDSSTIEAGSVTGLFTALAQVGALVVGWLRGSDKTVKAANVRALYEQQAAADHVARARAAQPPPWATRGQPETRSPGQYPPAQQYPAGGYPPQQYPPQPYPPQPYPPQPYPPQQYPQQPYGQPHRP